MKPNSFEYVKAGSLDEALSVLSERGDAAKVLAGGQSLIPAMNMRFAAPDVLVDISGIAGLQEIQSADGVLRIGAMSRHVDVLKSDLVTEHAPLIAKAVPHIAHATVRNRGTFGGSLCHADPAAELPACVLALDGRLNIRGPSGSRHVPAAEFFRGTYATCLAEDEILVSVDVPAAAAETVVFFDEVVRRKGDYPLAGLAAQASVRDGRLAGPRLVYFGVGDVALSAPSAEQILDDAQAAEIDADAVCASVAEDISPFDDLTTSGAAKRAMMQVLTRRALDAFARQGDAA